MKVLFATTEFADFAKAGGLGDVSASLPRALTQRGLDVRVLMPGYPEVIARAASVSIVADLPARAGIPPCLIGEVRMPDGLILYLVLAPSLVQRTGMPYGGPAGRDWDDNDVRFGRFSLAAAELAKGASLSWMPDVLHVNDWPGGLAPAYLRWDGASVPTILTIHNIAHQGIFDKEHIHRLGIPESAFDIYGVEFHDRLSFLKAGLFYADHITTVSPTYAREITTEALGGGLHGLVQTIAAQGRLSGILNGIDESWNPESDPHLPRHFDAQDVSGKQAIAGLVRTGLCLKPSDGPLFGVVSRLVQQKGLDVIADVADAIVRDGGQIAMLGLGDPDTEHMLNRLARSQRDHIALLNGFNDAMGRRIVAASHFCLMPSRFEPCGLVQMQAQRYGSLPIAHATGGLVDTIRDGETGFLFSDFSAEGLYGACRRAFEAYADARVFAEMRYAAMSRSFRWSAAAEQYEALYRRLSGRPAAMRPRPLTPAVSRPLWQARTEQLRVAA
jgi:starch synthase